MNKKLRSTAGALLLLTMGLHAQQPAGPASAPPALHDFSLAQAIDYAGKNSVIVKNALLDYEIQEQSNRATTSLISSRV